MSYSPFYSQWKDWPDVSTPITSAALQHIENGIGQISFTSAAIPAGANDPFGNPWQVGQIVYSTDPATLGFIGWVCVSIGPPVWKTWGAVSP